MQQFQDQLELLDSRVREKAGVLQYIMSRYTSTKRTSFASRNFRDVAKEFNLETEHDAFIFRDAKKVLDVSKEMADLKTLQYLLLKKMLVSEIVAIENEFREFIDLSYFFISNFTPDEDETKAYLLEIIRSGIKRYHQCIFSSFEENTSLEKKDRIGFYDINFRYVFREKEKLLSIRENMNEELREFQRIYKSSRDQEGFDESRFWKETYSIFATRKDYFKARVDNFRTLTLQCIRVLASIEKEIEDFAPDMRFFMEHMIKIEELRFQRYKDSTRNHHVLLDRRKNQEHSIHELKSYDVIFENHIRKKRKEIHLFEAKVRILLRKVQTGMKDLMEKEEAILSFGFSKKEEPEEKAVLPVTQSEKPKEISTDVKMQLESQQGDLKFYRIRYSDALEIVTKKKQYEKGTIFHVTDDTGKQLVPVPYDASRNKSFIAVFGSGYQENTDVDVQTFKECFFHRNYPFMIDKRGHIFMFYDISLGKGNLEGERLKPFKGLNESTIPVLFSLVGVRDERGRILDVEDPNKIQIECFHELRDFIDKRYKIEEILLATDLFRDLKDIEKFSSNSHSFYKLDYTTFSQLGMKATAKERLEDLKKIFT